MNREIIQDAQRYLTVNNGFRNLKIVDIESLSHNHDTDELVMLLCDLYYEKHKLLSDLMERDDNSILLDQTIGAMFRMTMAIRLINDENREEVNNEYIEQRAAAGG